MSLQLPLSLQLNDSATFANFVAEQQSFIRQMVESMVRESVPGTEAAEPFLYLWGASGTGKTHLLQAVCHLAAQQGKGVFYLPLLQAAEFSVELLEGLESLEVICMDDVHAIAGVSEWEQALFHLYNRVRDRGGVMIVTANATPAEANFILADLVSRLGWGGIYHLAPLDDVQKIQALQLRAHSRGFELPQDSGNYLLRRYPRDMHALFALLDELDTASLVAQRRLTIPFIRQVLESGGK